MTQTMMIINAGFLFSGLNGDALLAFIISLFLLVLDFVIRKFPTSKHTSLLTSIMAVLKLLEGFVSKKVANNIKPSASLIDALYVYYCSGDEKPYIKENHDFIKSLLSYKLDFEKRVKVAAILNKLAKYEQ